MKKKIWLFISRTLKFIALVAPLVFMISYAQDNLFYYRDHNTLRVEEFYEEEMDSLDVVFMGCSEVFNGFAPGQAYEKHGFTSYMYAMDRNAGSLYVSQLKDILKYQMPQMIVVELYGMLDNEPICDETRLRIYLENSPMTLEKAKLIMEQPFEDKLSFLVPFFKYHGDLEAAEKRLRGISKEEVEDPDLHTKGVFTRTHVYDGPGYTGIEFDPETFELSPTGVGCVTQLLEFCKSEGLDNVLFVNFPWCVAKEDNNVAKLVSDAAKIVEQYGYPFLDLQKDLDKAGLDPARDFYDEQHVNYHGQQKLTDYISSVLVNDYGVVAKPMSHENKMIWETAAIQTHEYYLMADRLAEYGVDTYVTELSVWWSKRYEIIQGAG